MITSEKDSTFDSGAGLGLKHIVMCGGGRNYIERWFETFKDKLRAFDCYSPTHDLESVQNFCWVFGFLYNRYMWHRSAKELPSGGGGGLELWVEVFI